MRLRFTTAGDIIITISAAASDSLTAHRADRTKVEWCKAGVLLEDGPDKPDWEPRAEAARLMSADTLILREFAHALELSKTNGSFRFCVTPTGHEEPRQTAKRRLTTHAGKGDPNTLSA